MKKINRIMVRVLHDPITSMSEDEAKMYPDRFRSQNDGWCYVGVQAEAEIATGGESGSWLANTVSSGGLWGIESDSQAEYFHEVAAEERDELLAVLLELGFTQDQFPTAWEWVDETYMVDLDLKKEG